MEVLLLFAFLERELAWGPFDATLALFTMAAERERISMTLACDGNEFCPGALVNNASRSSGTDLKCVGALSQYPMGKVTFVVDGSSKTLELQVDLSRSYK